MYMTRRVISFDSELNEINTITLDRELRSRDVNAVEIELKELVEDEYNGGDTVYGDIGIDPQEHGIVDYNPKY